METGFLNISRRVNWFVLDCLRLDLRAEFGATNIHECGDADILTFSIAAHWEERLSIRRNGTRADRLKVIAARYARLCEVEYVPVMLPRERVQRIKPENIPPQSRRLTYEERQRQERNAA